MPIEFEQQKYIDIITELEKGFAKINAIRPLRLSEEYFNGEFAISACHNSNAIEGNTFTFDETKLLLERGIISGVHSLRESEDIIGYKQAFDFLYQALREGKPIDEEFILKLHSFVLRGSADAGKYRTIQNYVGDMFNVKYTPCPPKEVQSKMSKYLALLGQDLATINVGSLTEVFHTLAKHHIEFEKIHPFVDGNGRTGRLLLTYEIISLGLLPVDIRYEERKRYYAALSAYDTKEKRSTRPESKTEPLAKLIAESELRSVNAWLRIFADK